MKLIVGLGNPGEKYAGNRHNIGFMAVEEMARGYSFGPWKKRFQGLTAEGQIGLERCILLKPSTYMNESGRAVGEAMRFYKIPLGDVIVIHDEIDLKPGAIRVKTGGGNAGHNGLRSVSAHIGNDYLRVRLGVDHPGDKALVAHYVLQDFAKADQAWLIPLLEGVARGMAKLVEGSEAAFLSEAARGRKPSAPAVKLNGVAPPQPEAAAVKKPAPMAEAPVLAPEAAVPAAREPVATAAPASEIEPPALRIEGLAQADTEALAAIVAAASKPIEPMPAPTAAPFVEQPAPLAARAPEPAPAVEPIVTATAEAETETVLEARSAAEAVAAPEPEPATHVAAVETIQAPAQPAPELEPILQPAAVEAVVEPEPVPRAAAVEAAAPEPAIAHPAAVEAVAVVEAKPAPAPEPVTRPAATVPVPEMAPAAKPAPILQPQPAKLAAASEPAAQQPGKPEAAAAHKPAAKKAEAPKAAAPKPQAAPAAKKEGNIFSRWFRNRVRGGGYH
jgi:peptidyl-tRNA hydrolase, PTH1 family